MIRIEFPRMPDALEYYIHRHEAPGVTRSHPLIFTIDDSVEGFGARKRTVRLTYRTSLTYVFPDVGFINPQIYVNGKLYTSPVLLDPDMGTVRFNQPLPAGSIVTSTYTTENIAVYDDDREQPEGVHRIGIPAEAASFPTKPQNLTHGMDQSTYVFKWSKAVRSLTNYYYQVFYLSNKNTIHRVGTEQHHQIVNQIKGYSLEISDSLVKPDFYQYGFYTEQMAEMEEDVRPFGVRNAVGDAFLVNKKPVVELLWAAPLPSYREFLAQLKTLDENNQYSQAERFPGVAKIPAIIDSIIIKRRKASGPYDPLYPTLEDENLTVATIDKNETFFVDNNVDDDTYYNYSIWAISPKGAHAEPSKISVFTGTARQPDAPNITIQELRRI